MMTSALKQICALTHTRTLSNCCRAAHASTFADEHLEAECTQLHSAAYHAESILKRHQLKRPRNASSIAISHSSEDGDSLGNEESRKHVR